MSKNITPEALDIRLNHHEALIIVEALEAYQEYLDMKKEEAEDMANLLLRSMKRFEDEHPVD
jgi:hypothetical protein